MSGGEKRHAAPCHLPLKKPDNLFLDRPTNRLDTET